MTAIKMRPGALEFPSRYQVMNEEEMMYVEGGKTIDSTLLAKDASNYLKNKRTLYNLASAAGSVTAAAGLGLGVLPGLVAGVAAAMWIAAASQYSGAFNDCEKIRLAKGNNALVRVVEQYNLFSIPNSVIVL